MSDKIFDAIIQANRQARKEQAQQEQRNFILGMAILCGIGIIILQLIKAYL